MKNNIFALTILCFWTSTLLIGQSYNNAFGLRMGTDWGLSYKHRIAKRLTIEAIGQSSLQREEVILTLLLEKHLNLITRKINIYWGGGIHKGWIDDVFQDVAPEDPFGLSFIGGAELSIGRMNLSYDFKPAINLQGGEKRFYTQSGITARYILNKRKKYGYEKNKNKRKRKKRNSNMNRNTSWKFWKKDR